MNIAVIHMGRRKPVSSSDDDAEPRPVISMTMDESSVEPKEVSTTTVDEGFQTPCTLQGVMAGFSGGTLGFLFGFGKVTHMLIPSSHTIPPFSPPSHSLPPFLLSPTTIIHTQTAGYWLKNHIKGSFRPSLTEGWSSAKTFALFGGLYAASSCFVKRIRQTEDRWNGAISGCTTGLVLGWGNGPLPALQSCALLGAFSYFLGDSIGANEATAATMMVMGEGNNSSSRGNSKSSGVRDNVGDVLKQLLAPALPLVGGTACPHYCRIQPIGNKKKEKEIPIG